MAILKNGILGSVTGAAGDIVFRTRNGKTYISSKASLYPPRNDVKSVAIRKKFRFCTRLFSAIGKVFWLKFLWNNGGRLNSFCL